MNDKTKKFCEEYIKDFNGQQAAIRAGYSAKCAGSQAHRLLKKAEVRQKINSIKASLRDDSIASAKDILRLYTNVLTDPEEKTANRLKAGELLGKYLQADFAAELAENAFFPASVDSSRDILGLYTELYDRIRTHRITTEQAGQEMAVLSGLKGAYESINLENRIEALEQVAMSTEDGIEWDD